MDTTWLEQLGDILPPEQWQTGQTVREQHARGESFDQAVLPDVVVFAESTEDVQKVMQFASEHGIPVTPVAINSSLEGHTVPLNKGISLDLTRLNRILEFKPEDLLIVLQPAVTYPQVNDYVRRSGLFFPIDPGAHASLGGMIATNASGTMAVGYGVTADYVLALEVVTPSGQIIRTGTRARKSSSGYSLTKLFCGAEGTLGVVTQVTLRLTGLPEAASAARVPFGSIADATRYVTSLIQAGLPLARCELVDPAGIRAVNEHQGTDYPEETTIFLEFHGNPEGVVSDAQLAHELASEHGASSFEASSDPAEREQLWEARHNMFYAMVAAHPGKRNVVTDVAVPISQLAEAVALSLQWYAEEELPAFVAGHVGDGNFHFIVFFAEGDAEAEARIAKVSHKMIQHALSVGGTSTGEHGVGIRKLKYMREEHGEALDVMIAIKHALDPKGIMNPGKKLPPS